MVWVNPRSPHVTPSKVAPGGEKHTQRYQGGPLVLGTQVLPSPHGRAVSHATAGNGRDHLSGCKEGEV